MDSPWQSLARANLTFCEADLPGWIAQPGNTWTNVGFLIAGVAIWLDARRKNAPMAGWLGPVALLTGLASTALHATGTLVGQLVDQGVMFLESALFVALNLGRWLSLGARTTRTAYLALAFASAGILVGLPTAGIALFVAHVVAFLAIEAALFVRGPRARYGFLLAVAVVFALSYACWWADRLRLVCNPDDHVLPLHGVWHLLGALSFYLWFRFYAQFGR